MRPTFFTTLVLFTTLSSSLMLSAMACSTPSYSPTKSAMRSAEDYPALRAPRTENGYLRSSVIAPVAYQQPDAHISGYHTGAQPSASSVRSNKDSSPPTPSELGRKWFYGAGLGRSLLNVGTSIAFPPYALYLLGNAGLEVSGLPTLYVSNALPKRPKSFIMSFYDGITSVPGRLTALASGTEYNESEASALEATRMFRLHSREE